MPMIRWVFNYYGSEGSWFNPMRMHHFSYFFAGSFAGA